jgi:hypothetical protein
MRKSFLIPGMISVLPPTRIETSKLGIRLHGPRVQFSRMDPTLFGRHNTCTLN